MSTALTVACDLLRRIAADIDAGHDVTPAERFALEGLLNQALAEGVAPSALRAAVVAWLPKGGTLRVDRHDDRAAVELQLWQSRAPVVPSTSD